MKLANYEPTDLERRLDKALDWWCSDEVTKHHGGQPDEATWAKLINGLERLKADGAPGAIETALVIARDESVRCWGMIFLCLNAANGGSVKL